MSLKQQHGFSVPEQTRRVARAPFPKGRACLRVADVLRSVYQDRQFALCSRAAASRPKRRAVRLSRPCCNFVLQFIEGLPDRQAADAVRFARADCTPCASRRQCTRSR